MGVEVVLREELTVGTEVVVMQSHETSLLLSQDLGRRVARQAIDLSRTLDCPAVDLASQDRFGHGGLWAITVDVAPGSYISAGK